MMKYQFSNQQPVVIGEVDPSTIKSVISVADVSGEVVDVNVKVDISHSFTSDLKITLHGPVENDERVSVTLVEKRGGRGDNFNLTQFDDEAGLDITASAAPFAGSFRPEQALASFDGGSANGEWQLEINDLELEDGGELKGWFLELEVDQPGPQGAVFTSVNPVAIEAESPNRVSSLIHVTGLTGKVIESLEVGIELDHSFDRDLVINLVDPQQRRILLVNRRGGSGDNFTGTVFSDSAEQTIAQGVAPFSGRFRPEQPLSMLRNQPLLGAWMLEIEDEASQDGGQLKAWSLHFSTADAPEQPENPFHIDVRFVGGLSATQQAVFADAADRWSQIIVADLPDFNFGQQVIDGVLIFAKGEHIDGAGGSAGNILGQARPLRLRRDSKLPAVGEMTFDSFDLDRMERDGSLLDVIIHEMGHVLGIGTIWKTLGLVEGLHTNNPVFTGSKAMQVYQELSGNASLEPVPVANTGGPGTFGGHWRELDFGHELMTGRINHGRINPVSRLTVAALEDMGYHTDPAAAEAYQMPARQLLSRPTHRSAGCCSTLEDQRAMNSVILETQFMDSISWSVNAGAKSGPSSSDSGALNIEGVFSSEMQLPANQDAPQQVDLQLEDVSKLDIFMLTSSVYGEHLEVQGAGDLLKLSGPLLLFGEAIGQFSSSLASLAIQNKHPTQAAKVKLLIGRALS